MRWPPDGHDHAVHRRDIAVVATHSKRDVIVGGRHRIGRVEPDPAGNGAAPNQHPGMHGVGALQPGRAVARHRAQIAADIGRRQADAAQARDHDMREVLADAAPQGERHRRRGGHRGRAGVVDHVGLDPAHEVERALEDRTAGREACARIVADFRIERHHAAGEQEMRRRGRPDVGGGEDLVAHRFERRRRQQRRVAERVNRDAGGDFHGQPVVPLGQCDPGNAVAEEVLSLAPLRRLRHDLQ